LELVDRRGATAVFAARWITVVRAVVPTAAGMVGMPRGKFFAANCLGAATWAPAVVLVGYVLGDSMARAEQVLAWLPLVGVVTVVLMIAAAGIRAARTRRHPTREPVAVDTPGDAGPDGG
jgi:membrane protein DedA with SNARE-associated domain